MSSAVVVLGGAYDAPLLAKWNDPASGTIRSCKLVRAPFFGEMAANGLRLGVDSGANELVLDPDEDGPEIKAGECFLIGRLNVGVGKRSRAGDDSADKTVHGGACLVHIPHRGCVEQGARPLGLTLESSWK